MRLTVCVAVTLLLAATAMGQAIGDPGLEYAAGGAWSGELPPPSPGPSVNILTGVPVYTWYHGCGPTAMGMIIGYWDSHGFGALIPGSSDIAVNRTVVEDMMASPGHIRDYVPTPDRVPTAEDPLHVSDSLADFSGTSIHPLGWGWAYLSKQDDGLRLWAESRGYTATTSQRNHYTWETLWWEFKNSINVGAPVELLIDSDANGVTDHFITAVGYDSAAGNRKYAAYVTWDTDLHWFEFERIAPGQSWGVYGATFFTPVPEPATIVMLALGGVAMFRRRKTGSR